MSPAVALLVMLGVTMVVAHPASLTAGGAPAPALEQDCHSDFPELVENSKFFTNETERIVICKHPDDKVCKQPYPDPIARVSINFTLVNTAFFNLELTKESEPVGAADFICSFGFDFRSAVCVRTYLHGSLSPQANFKGPGGLQMMFNSVSRGVDRVCRAASVSIMRHVYFDAGSTGGQVKNVSTQVAAVGRSLFNLSAWSE